MRTTMPIDVLIKLLKLMKEENGVRIVDINELARDIDRANSATISSDGDVLARLIASCAFFEFVNSSITLSNFPTPRIPVLSKTKVYEFEDNFSLLRAQRIMREEGFRGATMSEGALWARRHPNFRGCILLPGQKARFDADFYVGVLDERGYRRGLDLICITEDFPPLFRILAVRK